MAKAIKNQSLVPTLLRDAVELHQMGRLVEAERLYDKVLKIDRQNGDALNLKGVIAADQGRATDALALFNRAIAQLPSFSDAHFNKGNALAVLGKPDAAVASYAEAIRLRPNFADARLNASALFEKIGRQAEALAYLRATTQACPNEPRGYYALGVFLTNNAEIAAGESVAAEASAALDRALALAPNNADTHCAIASLCTKRGEFKRAAEHLQAALALNPTWTNERRAEIYSTLGEQLRRLEQYPLAVAAQRQALALKPADRDIRHNLGTALYATRELAEAEELFRGLLETDPDFVRPYINLGNVYRDTNRLDQAGVMFEAALAIEPALAVAYSNLGAICADQGWFRTGILLHDKAVALHDTPGARFKRAVTVLATGRLREGWRDYDYRFLSPTERLIARPEPPPTWRGEDLTGKSILIWTEQGMGDEILHACLISEIAKRATRCRIDCTKRLMPVFARSFPGMTIGDRDNWKSDEMGTFDYQTPIASLGRYLLRDFADFPKHSGYLMADAERTAQLRHRYLARAGKRKIVGISWRSKNDTLGPDKSAALTDLAPVLQNPDIMLVNLQYGDCDAEIAEARATLGVDVFQDPEVDSATDMDAFFAQVAAMDLVITTSNTTAHVAGAQNMPVWVLLPFAKGVLWYWFLGREDSPWYPSARLVRADKFDASRGWVRLLAPRVASALDEFVENNLGPR